MKASLGPSVVLVKKNLKILVVTNAVYENKDEHYKCFDLNYKENKIVVLKNLMNFRKLLNKETSFIVSVGRQLH